MLRELNLWYQPQPQVYERAYNYFKKSCQYRNELLEISRLTLEKRVEKLLLILEKHNPDTLAHVFKVALVATSLVMNYFRGSIEEALPFIEEVFVGALLHDIGKIVVPRKILNSDKSQLLPEDKETLNLHSQLGSVVLESVGLERYRYFCDEHHIGNNNNGAFEVKDIRLRHPLTEFVGIADALCGQMDPRRNRGGKPPKSIHEVLGRFRESRSSFSDETFASFNEVVLRVLIPPFPSTVPFERNKIFMELAGKYGITGMIQRNVERRKPY
ncbi:hypothetical protein B6D29_02375 [Microgenomates bacterium UTCPR1]|nr:MAG: hypothetical protein B6D29_02375 [Microgenomates bacterium UTCPR1]